MPIYEYACPDCGYTYDHMQKMADAPIAACPKCASTKYYKKLSAAGFALKGTGWYVTDFRDGGKKSTENKDSKEGAAAPAPAAAPAAAGTASTSTPAAAPAPSPAPAPAPASPSKSE
jgi:putative FmdB family regulatory protein